VKRRLFSLAIALVALLSTALSPATASAAPAQTGTVGGVAFAAYVIVPPGAPIAGIGPLFPTSLGCVITNRTAEASAASASLGLIGNVGALDDKVTATISPSAQSVQSVSDVAGISLLAGLIQATEIKSVANTTGSTFIATSNANGTVFTNLKVAGIPILFTPAANTRINLLGIGSVTLNEQLFNPIAGRNKSSATVVGIDIHVSVPLNVLGIPVGTRILVSYANSSFDRLASPVTVSGDAYSLYALALNGGVTSGPWSLVFQPSCSGGTNTVSVLLVTVPGVVTAGTMTDTISGSITSQGGTETGTSTIQGVNLLGGVITADAVTGTASATFPSSGTTGTTSASTTLANLEIGGISISANPGPNTIVNVPGFGFVIINEQYNINTSGKAEIQMHGLDIFITVPGNVLNIPVGAQIIITSVDAFVDPLSTSGSAPSHSPVAPARDQVKAQLHI